MQKLAIMFYFASLLTLILEASSSQRLGLSSRRSGLLLFRVQALEFAIVCRQFMT